jgi:S-DNA-T family DNA segregation ATPase FtsK/SpoIIIE
MIVSNHLGVEKAAGLLEGLKEAIRDFAAREEKLVNEFRIKLARERQRRDAAVVEETEKLQSELAGAEAAFANASKLAAANHERRKARIAQARKTSKEQALTRIESKTGARKYELQKRRMQTERNQETALANTAAQLEERRANLADSGGALARLERRARGSFGSYWNFRFRLSRRVEPGPLKSGANAGDMLSELRGAMSSAEADIKRFRRLVIPFILRILPMWLLMPFCAAPWALQHFGVIALGQSTAMGISAGLFIFVWVLFLVGLGQSAGAAGKIINELRKAKKLHATCSERNEVQYQEEIEQAKFQFQTGTQMIESELKQAVKDDVAMKGTYREEVDEKTMRITGANERIHRARVGRLEQEHAQNMERLQNSITGRTEEVTRTSEEQEARINAELEERWRALEAEWKSKTQPVYDAYKTADTFAQEFFPPWTPESAENWKPPTQFADAAKFGRLDADVDLLAEAMPKNARLALPGPPRFSFPLMLTYPEGGSILLETSNAGHDDSISVLNNIILRLLSVAPPGRLNFTVFDPVGLGQNFAGVMHLADFEERLINSKIWTQAGQIEQKLADLNEHMEKVIQMYLRNEYHTIAEYNKAAGNIAEKYHFLVVADFPANFSDVAVKRLLSIAASGARCGVYTLIHWDRRQSAPQDFVPDELRKSCVCLSSRPGGFILSNKALPGVKLDLDPEPPPEVATAFVQKVGKVSIDSSRVEVPFEHVAPPDAEMWTEDTTSELRCAIGRTGATKLQYLAIGKGTRQHALIAGKTGSGKSTLFHVMITNLALWCSPEQVEFYLVDFKKGVEFKCYGTKRLPHARVVAIESDREFGLSVLQRVDAELKRRGDLFRKLGVQDVAGYKRAGGTEPIPRSLLMIDEFQEFFVEEDKVSQGASLLLDRIVRQGRAFGIHVILGSQTLGGAYSMARATLGQMVIRIALQCNEADAYLIMDDSNPAPRLLSRPGEGIYNDTAGTIEGNSPFQTVWLSDDVRDGYLTKVRKRADHSGVNYPDPIVFEGDAAGDVRENTVLRELLQTTDAKAPALARIWLGAPNSIKGPTEAVFQNQSGSNLLIVGQREEAVLAIVSLALVSLAAQFPRPGAKFILFDSSAPGTPPREFLERIVKIIPQGVTVAKGDLGEIVNSVAVEMKRRGEDEHSGEAPPIFMFFHGIQKYNKLRNEEDFSFSTDDAEKAPNPGAQLNQIICEGARLGIHVLATCDTYNNVNRFFSRKAFSEFETRVLFQMSAGDSASLIDNPKAGNLGMHRAVLYNEQEGYLEVFRPYALPDGAWLDETAAKLSQRPA